MPTRRTHPPASYDPTSSTDPTAVLGRRRTGGFGWRRDLPDPRDFMYSAPMELLRALPASVDLRPRCPPVYDQGPIGSCTANAIAAAVQFGRRAQAQHPDFVPSRLFIYYNERLIEHDVGTDAGAMIRDGIKVVYKLGVPPETDWPYVPTPPPTDGGAFPPGSPPATRPPAQAYTDAARYQVTSYLRLQQTLSQLRGCLAAGYPFVFGFTVFESLYTATGRPRTTIPLPSDHDQPLGGHAVCCVGYDDAKQLFTIRNSWGASAGDHGYFYMPYAYLTDHQLASDFWTIRAVEA